jgi:hypothetical protein
VIRGRRTAKAKLQQTKKPPNPGSRALAAGQPGGTPYRLPSDTGSEAPGVVPCVCPELLISLSEEAPLPEPVLADPLDPLAPLSPDVMPRIWLHPVVIDASARMAIRARGDEEK